jgi:hypothetical protein
MSLPGIPGGGLQAGAGSSGSAATGVLPGFPAAAPPGGTDGGQDLSADGPSPGQPPGPGDGGSAPAPARVAAVSYVVDILETVSKVSPGIANGVAATVLGKALAGLPGPVQETVASGTAKLAEQLSAEGPRTMSEVRRIVAHLSAANPEVNRALTLVAEALSGVGLPALSPLDRTARQLSEALRALAEPAPSAAP